MKKRYLLLMSLLALMVICGMTGCGRQGGDADIEIDYGTSELYTQEDMDQAIAVIREEFSGWEGCELYDLRYVSDDVNTEDNLKWLNEVAEEQGMEPDLTQCIEFLSDFHSPIDPGEDTAWEADTDYNDYQWWLARSEGGEWKLMANGY